MIVIPADPCFRPHRYRSRPTPPHWTAAIRAAWDSFQLTAMPHTHQKKKGSSDVAPLQDKADQKEHPHRPRPPTTQSPTHPRRRQGVTRAGRCPTPRGRGEPKPHETSRSPNTGEGSREPKIPSTRNHKNNPTRRGEEERKTKATQRKQNETKTRKAKESTGTEREKRRKDARTGQPREEAEMKAW